MALARARRNETGLNYWPGFVDALSTLVLSIVFLLSVFLVVQFFLSQEVTGKDKALEQLNAKIAQLNELLSLEKLGKLNLDDQISQLRAGLASAEAERDRVKGLYEGLAGAGNDAAGKAAELNKALESEKGVSSRALAQIEVLTQQITALRRQLAALEEALDASEKRDKESQGRIADLGQRLNVALAQRVQELSRYRSEFFGRLRAILGNRPDIRIVGDRFVFQSEVFFDTGQALLLPEGRAELDQLATALIDLDKQIPAEIAWVLRVDGHTDVRPINSPLFKSNWELSSARAISVVQYLISLGVPAQRLVAAGFAEFQPRAMVARALAQRTGAKCGDHCCRTGRYADRICDDRSQRLSRPARGQPHLLGLGARQCAARRGQAPVARSDHAIGQHRQCPRHPLLRTQRFCEGRRRCKPDLGPAGAADGVEAVAHFLLPLRPSAAVP